MRKGNLCLYHRKLIDIYMAELLAVELPSFEVMSNERELLIFNSVCISIENLKLIPALLGGAQGKEERENDRK